jgi:hypothetical protein
MQISSPYPPGWDAAAEEDRLGYNFNIQNGWSGDGSELLDPDPAAEFPRVIPYRVSTAKADYWKAGHRRSLREDLLRWIILFRRHQRAATS